MLLGIRWKSMRLKIIAWSFIPTTIILGAVALVMFIAYQQVTEDLVLERNQDVARLAAGQLTTELSEYSGILTALARTGDIYRADPQSQQAALERSGNRLVVFDGGVLILNTHGTVVAADPPRPDALGSDWSDRPYFQQILRSTGPVFSNITPDGLDGRDVITVAVPITDEQGAFRGTMVGLFRLGDITISPFYGSIVKLRLSETGSTYLVDETGRLIYHSDSSLVGQDLSSEPFVQQVLAGRVGSLRTQDAEDEDILAAYAPVPGTPWGLITEEKWATLSEAGQEYRYFLLVLLALGIIVPALVVTAGVQLLIQPINDLNAAAKAVAMGNFGHTITVNTGDELEELANQFNRMSAQLQRSYNYLEQRIAGRTQALSTINAIAAVVSRSMDLDETLQDALDKTLEITSTEAGGVLQFNEDDAEAQLHLTAQRGLSAAMVERIGQLPLDTDITVQRAIRKGRPVIRERADYPEGAWRSLLADEGWQRIISIPLVTKGKSIGTITLFTSSADMLIVEHIQLLAAIGQQIGVAIENAQLYAQARQLAMAQERQRLARDLHDSVTQALYGVTLYAEAANRQLAVGETELAIEHLNELRATAQEALREIRLLIFELRPPILEEQGLTAALQARLESVEGRSGLKTILDVADKPPDRLPLDTEMGLYRIAQEALNNVLKHAQAQEVHVRLRQAPSDHKVVLEIADDGQGFDATNGIGHGRLGLHTMRERAALLGGDLTITSQPGAGTTIRVEITDDQSN
ncbi:MAG: GAF domain-containing protein [Anaerolineales bacterium]|nr:GAF domain-containing protein [Anaerolineales bacterium]